VATAERDYSIEDLGTQRVLRSTPEYRTYYSARLLEMLIARKGLDRAPLYLPFKRRAPSLPRPALPVPIGASARSLPRSRVGCSFGHNTEYLKSNRSWPRSTPSTRPDFVR